MRLVFRAANVEMENQQSSQSESSGDGALKQEQTSEEKHESGIAEQHQDEATKKGPSKLKQLWTKTGLDVFTILLMVKGSLPPTIAIAIYQSKAVADQYSTLGYLVAITSILGFAIMPRGKFLQTMTLNVFGVCLGAAISLLALWSSIQARKHTTPAGSTATYNSSQSAVCAIWLFFQVYCINVLRSSRPQFQFPCIIYSIFAIVSMTYGPEFPTMLVAISFMKKLIKAFLTGFALATGVSLFFVPVSSRTVAFKEMTGYLQALRGIYKAHAAYMRSLETVEPAKKGIANESEEDEDEKTKKKTSKARKNAKKPSNPLSTPQGAAVQAILAKIGELHTKLAGDLTPAKREVAYGKLDAGDLSEMFKLLRGIFIPTNGLCSLLHILERVAERNPETAEQSGLSLTDLEDRQIDELHFIMKQLHEPFADMSASMDQAFEHVLLTLQLVKPPKKKQDDEEAKGATIKPGDEGFAAMYKEKVDGFYTSKQVTLEAWCAAKGIELPPDFFETSWIQPEGMPIRDDMVRDRRQRQLFFILYLEYLLWRSSRAVLDFVLFADQKARDGQLSKSRFLFPGQKRMRKWVTSIFGQEDVTKDENFMNDVESGGSDSVYLGTSFGARKDPEHMAPTNAGQRLGEKIRLIPKFFRSDASAFGFRVACATMSIAIVGYLRDTQSFFIKQRLLWAMIMVAISMTRTAGQSMFNFVLRVFGTFVAMCGAYVIWYIVDGHTAGVIVFLWLWMTCCFWIVLKKPKLVIVGILSIVTSVLIIGYELQVKVLGVEASEASGQPAYPTYLLAPYRLACVAGGILVAFIWTIWPYPISESTELRKDAGASMYLLANFYSVVHETVQSRIRGDDGDPQAKGTHAHRLDKSRDEVFSKTMALITAMKTNSGFSRFQLRVGGKFPAETYEALVSCIQNVLNYTALISYASTSFTLDDNDQEKSAWSADFRRLTSSVSTTSHEITSLLSLLSSSMSNGQPLPPYLKLPEPFKFVKKLEAMDRDILSIRHIAEPEYSAFAVIQISAQCLIGDLEKLTKLVKDLVGEIDFSFHAVTTSQSTSDTLLDSGEGKGKVD